MVKFGTTGLEHQREYIQDTKFWCYQSERTFFGTNTQNPQYLFHLYKGRLKCPHTLSKFFIADLRTLSPLSSTFFHPLLLILTQTDPTSSAYHHTALLMPPHVVAGPCCACLFLLVIPPRSSCYPTLLVNPLKLLFFALFQVSATICVSVTTLLTRLRCLCIGCL